ncbi:MAG: hypothetical protein KO464_07900 [Candidatus Methanofastidiosum sp.]|nr:hypothetical protein [Methanofastidiosum sp.]
MKDISDERKYEIPLYWKMLKISKEHIDSPTGNAEEDLYNLFAFSQIVYSMREKLKHDKYKELVTKEDHLFNYDEKSKNNTATSKITELSSDLRHYKTTQMDSRHTDAKVESSLGLTAKVYVNGILQSSNNLKKESNKVPNSYANTIISYIKILSNNDIAVPRETFYQCYEEIRKFMKDNFGLD